MIAITPDAANRNNRRIHLGRTQLCKVYGWSPEDAQARAERIASCLGGLAFNPGDDVKHIDALTTGVVISLNEGWLLVRWADGTHTTVRPSSLIKI